MTNEELIEIQYENYTLGELRQEWLICTKYINDFGYKNTAQKWIDDRYQARIAYIEIKFKDAGKSYLLD